MCATVSSYTTTTHGDMLEDGSMQRFTCRFPSGLLRCDTHLPLPRLVDECLQSRKLLCKGDLRPLLPMAQRPLADVDAGL